MKKSGMFALLISGCLGQAAFGAGTELAMNAGASIPLGINTGVLGKSAAVSLQAYHPLSPWISGGVELGYMGPARLRGDLSSAFGPSVDADGDGQPDNLQFDTNQHVHIAYLTPGFKVGRELHAGRFRWKPYAGVAGGFYFTHSNSGTLTLHGNSSGGVVFPAPQPVPGPLALDTNPTRVSDGVTNYLAGFNGGIGAVAYLSEHVELGVDLRYHQLLFSNAPDLQLFVPSLHAAYQF